MHLSAFRVFLGNLRPSRTLEHYYGTLELQREVPTVSCSLQGGQSQNLKTFFRVSELWGCIQFLGGTNILELIF